MLVKWTSDSCTCGVFTKILNWGDHYWRPLRWLLLFVYTGCHYEKLKMMCIIFIRFICLTDRQSWKRVSSLNCVNFAQTCCEITHFSFKNLQKNLKCWTNRIISRKIKSGFVLCSEASSCPHSQTRCRQYERCCPISLETTLFVRLPRV